MASIDAAIPRSRDLTDRRFGKATAAALLSAGLALGATAAAVTAGGSSSDYAWLEALARALSVVAPIAVGVYAWRRAPFQRFGAMLMLTGGVWFLTTLANSEGEVLYSIGRVAAWVVEPLLLYLLLTFPSGRLEQRIDRGLIASMVLMLFVLYLPTALVVDRYVVPGPWMSCVSDCPGNAFMVTDSQPAVIDAVVRPLRDILLALLFVAVAVRLAQRIHRSNRLVRRTVTPLLAVACLRCIAYGGGIISRKAAPDSTAVQIWFWLIALMVPVMSLAFLAGLARWWLFITRSTRGLATRLRSHPGPEDLRTALADAFEDPSLEILFRSEDGDPRWFDSAGQPYLPPVAASSRCLTEIADGDRIVAGIVHDRALRYDRAFVDTAAAYVLLTLENYRLSAQTASLLREVRESRARLSAAAADERRRIERDLHDGAQQRLVALGINLTIAAERSEDGDAVHAGAVMRRLGAEVEQALEELRSLTGGDHAARLADQGLVAALDAAARRNPLPATVVAPGVGRYSPEIESTVYFCCLEAMQNAVKHAHGATGVQIELCGSDRLQFEVRDDGPGFDRNLIVGGAGLRNIHLRLAAVGGELAVVSSSHGGTRVVASIPVTAPTRAAPGR
jgi:signal transduction histidine kinase